MKRNISLVLTCLCIALSITQSALPITILYSMKIRRVFSGTFQAFDNKDKSMWAFSAVPIIYSRSRHFEECAPRVDIREKRLLVGAVFDLRCTPSKNTWFEITTALENERARAKGYSENPLFPVCNKISKTGLDDIVLAAGYHLFPTEHAQLDFYVIAGFPTHTKISCDDALGTFLGTRFFSVGAGAEFSYAFLQSIPRSCTLITQARCIHFFDRPWDPILPCGSTIQPGDIVDLLCALRYREKHEIFEVGYNPTFFLNEAVKIPDQCKTRSTDFCRQGAYISYEHVFAREKHPVILGAGFSFNRAHVLDTRIYAGWVNCTVVF